METLSFIGNLSHPSINRWGSTLLWIHLNKNSLHHPLVLHQANLIERLISLFLKGGLTSRINTYDRVGFKWDPIDRKIEPKDESNYQRFYFRRVKFKSSQLDEEIHYFERRFNRRIYIGTIKTLHFKAWLLVVGNTLRTFRPKPPRPKRKGVKKGETSNLPLFTPLNLDLTSLQLFPRDVCSTRQVTPPLYFF